MDSVFATFKAIPWFSIYNEMVSNNLPTTDSHTLKFCQQLMLPNHPRLSLISGGHLSISEGKSFINVIVRYGV